MSPLALGLTLASALGWAALDALRKGLGRRVQAQVLVVWLSLGTAPLFLLWQISRGAPRFSAEYWLPGLVCGFIGIFANVLFVRSVSLSPISLTVPLLSLVPSFSLGTGALLLGEWPRPFTLAGICLVILASLGLFSGRGGRNPLSALRKEPGARLMIIVALLWALTSALDKRCLQDASAPLHAMLQNLLVGGGLLGWRITRGLHTPLPQGRQLRWLALAILSGAVGLGFQLLAIQQTLVSLMETLKRVVGLLAALAGGRLFFSEQITIAQGLAVLAMSGGLWLMLGPWAALPG